MRFAPAPESWAWQHRAVATPLDGIGRNGNDRADAALARACPDTREWRGRSTPIRVGCLVGQHHVRGGTGSSTRVGNTRTGHYLGEDGRVTGSSEVKTKAGGQHRPSAEKWLLVVSPPRGRPMAWASGSPARASFLRAYGLTLATSDRRRRVLVRSLVLRPFLTGICPLVLCGATHQPPNPPLCDTHAP